MRKSPSTSPGSGPEVGSEVEVRQQRRGGESAGTGARRPAVGPFPASIETLVTQPAFRAKTTAKTPMPPASSTRPRSTSPATASGGSRRWSRKATKSRGRCCRAPSSANSSGSPSPATRRRRSTRRPPRTSAATSPRSRRGSRRTPRTRSTTPTRSARNRSCSCLRPPSSARVGSAARSSTWPSRSKRSTETKRPSSTWRSTTTTIPVRACGPRSAPSICRASRGCSRSTEGRVSAVLEGAFGLEAMTTAVEKAIAE